MLRAGWTFLRLGSPIRDRPHSPKYACRGSGGQEAGTTRRVGEAGGNRYGVKKKRRGGEGGEKERASELVECVPAAAFKSDGSVDVAKTKKIVFYQKVLLSVESLWGMQVTKMT